MRTKKTAWVLWAGVLFALCGAAVCAISFAAQGAAEEKKVTSPKRWRYEYMCPAELEEAIKTRPIAWLVVSPLEWHGDALSFGCDPFVAQAIVDRAWEKLGGVRIPTLYLGVEIDYKIWEGTKRVDYWGMELGTKERNPGSIYVNPLTLELVLRDYLYFLQREGFKLCVVVSGHGTEDHLAVIRDVCSKYAKSSMRSVMWYDWANEPPAELRFEGAGQHADFDEASVLGGVDPNMVDKSRFGVVQRDRKVGLLQENAVKMDFDKGGKIIEFRATQLEKDINGILKEMNLQQPVPDK